MTIIPVAHLHLHCRRHIVRCAYGVAAHVFQDTYLADDGILVHGSSQGAEVVVQAYSLDLAADAVELETALCAHFDGAQADAVGQPVEDVDVGVVAALAQFLVEHGLQAVQVRCLGSPGMQLVNVLRSLDGQLCGAGAVGVDGCLFIFDGFAVGVEQVDEQLHVVARLVANGLCVYVYHRFVVGERCHAYEGCPLVEAHLVLVRPREHYLHRSVEAGTGVPARAFLDVFQVYLHIGREVVHLVAGVLAALQRVFHVLFQLLGDVKTERIVAVFPSSHGLAVHLHVGLGHRSVEHYLGS